jgi:hypothetical protein
VERVFKKLGNNIRLNNYNIESYLLAISDQNGEAIFMIRTQSIPIP